MIIPRFMVDAVSPRLIQDGLDDAFQRFVAETLARNRPALHVFPAAGKDGGIDLSATADRRMVAECKIVGSDDVAAVISRWQEVAQRLGKHLFSPDGPTSGQSQYAPWYRSEPAINEYLFCVSASLKNQARQDDVKITLRNEIQDFFRSLGNEHHHLSHLKDLTVQILDWDDLIAGLSPHAVFRWFHKTRILGLLPLQESASLQSFRAYLRSEKLPYYSRQEHLAHVPAPDGASVSAEDELLQTVRQASYGGIIISGAGGVGKSRLMYELGHLALQDGSTVLEVSTRLKPDTLEKLAEQLEPHNDVLLLIDYIETQHDFIQFAQELASINATLELRLRYVACCRSSYFPAVQHAGDAETDFLHLDLAHDHGLAEWLESYRRGTVQHILNATSVPDSARHRKMCGQTPVLAVFLAWLHENGRREELDELLDHEHGEFGSWLTKRVQKSFPKEQSVSRQLAELLSFFPLSNDQAVLLRKDETFDRLFERLQVDGWLERTTSSEVSGDRWETAHDVLADQVLLSYATDWLTKTADQFVARLFEVAADYGTIESVLVTLQRVADLPPFNGLDWEPLLRGSAESRVDAWQPYRTSLLGTSLLQAESRIRMLEVADLWNDVKENVNFQNSLGWLARAESRQSEQYPAETRELLRHWIAKTAPHVQQSNFLLTYGLQFDPDALKETAQRWIASQPEKFQTHYLIVRWLKLNLPTESVRTAVSAWAAKFCENPHLTYVAQAWLNAGGDVSCVEPSIKTWLALHQQTADAQFVYTSWLNSGSDVSFIAPSIKTWLTLHQQTAETHFVYSAWLDAGGDVSFVEPSIKVWLALHQDTVAAEFVYSAWLNSGSDVSFVAPSIKAWLALHQQTAEAHFVYKSWLDAGGDLSVVEPSINAWLESHQKTSDAGFVYKSWLDAGGAVTFVASNVKDWLELHQHTAEAHFVYKSWLTAGGDVSFVELSIKAWLELHQETSEAGFVFNAWLRAGGSCNVIEPAMRKWLAAGHSINEDADFFYKSWLDARGAIDVVQDAVLGWLHANADRIEISYVLLAWHDAGGDYDLIREFVFSWLDRYFDMPEGAFVSSIVVGKSRLPPSVARKVLAWCRIYHNDENAMWRISQLGSGLENHSLSTDLIDACRLVVPSALDRTIPLTIHEQSVLLNVMYLIHVHTCRLAPNSDLRREADLIFDGWCRHSASFCPYDPLKLAHDEVIRRLVFRIGARIAAGGLDVEQDRQAILRFIDWFNSCPAEWKRQCSGVFRRLRQLTDDDGLWDRVQL